jgi:ParB family chromosome partitioning protein
VPVGAPQVADERGGPAFPRSASADGAGGTGDDARALRPVPGARFAELPIALIAPNPRQPRQVFDEDALAELAQLIRQVGLLQPVVVRPVTGAPSHQPDDGSGDAGVPDSGGVRYELVMGERRWRAAQQAGLDTVPAIVRTAADEEMLRDALLENLHRAQLNPLEEAAAYQQLLDDFGCTQEELAQRIGRSRPQISNTLRLLRLPAPVARRVAAGVLSAGHARALLALDDAAAQERLAARIVAEGLSVRAVEEIVALGGDDQTPRPRPRRPRPVAPHAAELAERLSDRLETRVRVTLGRTRGRIVVEFASLDDLERIATVMDPTLAQARAGSGVEEQGWDQTQR